MDSPLPTTPPPGATKLVTDPDEQMVLTTYQETDARTAVTRGLKEYITGLRWEAPGGRLLKFEATYDTWPQAEKDIVFPSALVAVEGPGNYDASKFTPGVMAKPVDGYGIVQTAEFVADIKIGVWGTDNKARMGLVSMLEAFLSPTEFMYGLRLELPHYFNNRATYEPMTMAYEDSSEASIRRHRISVIMVRSSMSMLRLVQLPAMKPRFRVTTKTD